MAHKKGQGSSRNGRDSNAQRRGVKKFGGQNVKVVKKSSPATSSSARLATSSTQARASDKATITRFSPWSTAK